jgi:hypothetical protein
MGKGWRPTDRSRTDTPRDTLRLYGAVSLELSVGLAPRKEATSNWASGKSIESKSFGVTVGSVARSGGDFAHRHQINWPRA